MVLSTLRKQVNYEERHSIGTLARNKPHLKRTTNTHASAS